MRKVLIIEDDTDIAELITIHLRDLVCEIEHCTTGEGGLQVAYSRAFDLIILDVMLPAMNGLEVCRNIRNEDPTVPILMLTAKSEEIDKVLGLEMGADDYLTKPFGVREFIARVKAIFRRHTLLEKNIEEPGGKVLKVEKLMIEPEKRKVTAAGTRVDLTPKEYELLMLLISHPGKSFSREDLLNHIWGYEFSGYEHTVNSHINRLRSKIETDFSKPRYILTSWGIGYRFNDELPIEKN